MISTWKEGRKKKRGGEGSTPFFDWKPFVCISFTTYTKPVFRDHVSELGISTWDNLELNNGVKTVARLARYHTHHKRT